ncbi:regulator of chromosome condensation, putative [Plasmodium malariae]|uniref:Regulator of chromosome condensation, putative n=1 Tax=Plasmodium malariae TaxID=5858 RepID=A0A1A8W4J0_PLAMA|nr:regulator of chromosome condensation, putative [Plasmodium malariae]
MPNFFKLKKSKEENVLQPKLVTKAIISSDFIKKLPKYEDKRTIIYYWGKRVINENDDTPEHLPTIYTELSSVKIKEISCNKTCALFLSNAGNMYSFGKGLHGELGQGNLIVYNVQPSLIESVNNIKQIACGYNHSLCLSNDNILYSWGHGNYNGLKCNFDKFVPTVLNIIEYGDVIETTLNALSHLINNYEKCERKKKVCTQIYAKYYQSIAVCDNNTSMYIWGETYNNYLKYIPTFFYKFESNKIKQIAMGKNFAILLLINGELYGWGDGTYGELCRRSFDYEGGCYCIYPEQLILRDANNKKLPNINKVSAGARHVLLITEDEHVWSFGDKISGQCGISGFQNIVTTPKFVELHENNQKAKKVFCGERHSACINKFNQLYMWGHSAHHKLIFTACSDFLLNQNVQPGISIQSGLKQKFNKATLIYSMLHQKVTNAYLGDDFTIVVVGGETCEKLKQGDQYSDKTFYSVQEESAYVST